MDRGRFALTMKDRVVLNDGTRGRVVNATDLNV